MAAGDWKEMLIAAQEGNLALVRYHVSMGENPNYQHPEFLTTPLIEAATFGHLDIVNYLLENGADPSLRAGFSTDTALSMARKEGHREVERVLEVWGQGR